MTTNVNLAVNITSEQQEHTGTIAQKNNFLQHLAISKNGFVFDPNSGQSFTVNETGIELLRLFQQDKNVNTIVDSLITKYRVDSREIERDVLEFAGNLNRYFYI